MLIFTSLVESQDDTQNWQGKNSKQYKQHLEKEYEMTKKKKKVRNGSPMEKSETGD